MAEEDADPLVMTEEHEEMVRDAFSKFDNDGNGFITTNELGMALGSVTRLPPEEEMEKIVTRIDQDGDGTIDFTEFLTLVKQQMAETEEVVLEELEEAFNVFDQDIDGYISLQDILSTDYLFRCINLSETLTQEQAEEDIAKMFSEVDTSKNKKPGLMNLRQFQNMMISDTVPDFFQT